MSEPIQQEWSTIQLDPPDVPIVELPAATPATEARLVMAVVTELRRRDVPVRDIVVVAQDVERYEDLLVRAAHRQGIVPTVWKQLPLTETDPYRLCKALCEIFGKPTDIGTLVKPLEYGWTPSNAKGDWPYNPRSLRTVANQDTEQERTANAWRKCATDATWGDPRLETFCQWVTDQPEHPSPADIEQILGDVIQNYRERVLPARKQQDGPALQETVRGARAAVRMSELVDRIKAKYARWTSNNWADTSWATVGQICESLATQRPGRREHANARALDIIEANDAWGCKCPYVIAMGLADGIWPQRDDHLVPASIQEKILAGDDGLATVAPRIGWDERKERDQFADTVSTATEAVVCTRPTTDNDGIEQSRSPFLSMPTVTTVEPPAVTAFLESRNVPSDLARLLPSGDNPETEEGDQ